MTKNILYNTKINYAIQNHSIIFVINQKPKIMKEFKKEIRYKNILPGPNSSYNENMTAFIKNNQGMKILSTIVHRAYEVTIIYEVLIPVV